jgi:hypothetical protein
MPSTVPNAVGRFTGAAAVLVGCLIALGLAAGRGSVPVLALVAVAAAAFLPYGAALFLLRGPRTSRLLLPVFGAALLARLVLVAAPPTFSDDVYRYLWDGRMVLAGSDPYAHPPDAPELACFRDSDWAQINHPGLRTIYPPAAQGLFAVLAATGLGTTAFQLASALADFGVVLLVFLLAGGRLPRRRRAAGGPEADDTAGGAVRAAAAYGLCPLPCIETAMSGHLEPLALLPLLAGLLWVGRAGTGLRRLAGPALLGLAGAIKLVPLLLIPAFGRADRRAWPAAALIAALSLLPMAFTGPAAFGTMDAFARRWEGNASAFALVKAAAGAALEPWRDPVPDGLVHVPFLDGPARALQGTFFSLHKDGLFDPDRPGAFALEDLSLALAKLVSAAALLAIVIVTMRRRFPPVRAALWILGALVLVTPVLHPWYLLWVLPLAALRGAWPWFVLAGTSLLAYLPLDGWWSSGVWRVPAWIPWVEYGAFALAAAAWFILDRPSRRSAAG